VKKIMLVVLLTFFMFAEYSYVANQRGSTKWLEAENLVGVLLNSDPEIGSIFGGPDPINNFLPDWYEVGSVFGGPDPSNNFLPSWDKEPVGSIFGGPDPINNNLPGWNIGSIFGGPDPINNFLPDWTETTPAP